jgi:hypothetical protein
MQNERSKIGMDAVIVGAVSRNARTADTTDRFQSAYAMRNARTADSGQRTAPTVFKVPTTVLLAVQQRL